MKYLFGVVLPMIFQILVVFIVIDLNTGNGSWAGLGALLVGLIAIPATAIANAAYLASTDQALYKTLPRCFGLALLAPILFGLVVLIA
ncbi:MAG: hypothetical protein DHS20C11_15420 [Lysobacteraceae bacterium]|nr:MAG: hypothetical protein DHS20C11_15420 [Xanthomonadaceae bacterium]